MNFDLSKHAVEQIESRRLDKEEITLTLLYPDNRLIDSTFPDSEEHVIYQKKFVHETGSYLIRVFVNTGKLPPLVKTVYKTSKFEKYL